MAGHVDVCSKVARQYGADVNTRGNGDSAPLMLAAIFGEILSM